MATKTFKIGLNNADKTAMAQDVYERLINMCFDEYDPSEIYSAGDFVVYENPTDTFKLYKCNSNDVTGAWDSSKWDLATFQDLVDDVEDAVDSVADKANVDGNYPTMTVGLAEGLVTNRTIDDADIACPPITMGIAGDEAEIQTGINKFKWLEGASRAWNQLCFAENSTNYYVEGGKRTFDTTNNSSTYTANGTETGGYYFRFYSNNDKTLPIVSGHKYLIKFKTKITSSSISLTNYHFEITGINYQTYFLTDVTTDGIVEKIITPNKTGSGRYIMELVSSTAPSSGDTWTIKDFMFIDLTLIFGAGNEPTTVDEFKALFPLNYYAYDAGSILPSKSASLVSRGRNQFDGELESGYIDANGVNQSNNNRVRSKNFIPVVRGQEYHFLEISDFTFQDNYSVTIVEYDSNKSFLRRNSSSSLANRQTKFTISEDAGYIKFYIIYTTNVSASLADIQVVFSVWFDDGEGYDEYYSYRSQTVQLPNIELRSVPDYANGGEIKDIAYAEGGGKRRVEIVDLGSLPNITILSSGTANERVYIPFSLAKKPTSGSIDANILCSIYTVDSVDDIYGHLKDKAIGIHPTNGGIYIYDSALIGKTAEQVATALSGVYLIYEPATETDISETENPGWEESLYVDNYGTLQFTTSPEQIPQVEQPYFIEYTISLKEFLDSTYVRANGDAGNLALQEDIDKIEDGRTQVGRSVSTETIESDREIEDSDQACPPAVFSGIGGDAEIQNGNNAFEELRGNSVAFNQLLENGNFANISGWYAGSCSYTVSGNVATITPSAIHSTFRQTPTGINGHKYFYAFDIKYTSGEQYYVNVLNVQTNNTGTGNWEHKTAIITPSNTNNQFNIYDYDSDIRSTWYLKNVMLIDLTLMFGAGNEPTTVAEFNALFPEPYYAYHAGELLSSKSTGLIVREMNLLKLDRIAGSFGSRVSSNTNPRPFEDDKFYAGLADNNYYSLTNITSYSVTKNSVTLTTTQNGYGIAFPCRVIPGETYLLHTAETYNKAISWYDGDGNFISIGAYTSSEKEIYAQAPSNAYWGVVILRPTANASYTYTDVMFRLYYDTPNVPYEPYQEQTVSLPNLELRSAGEAYDVAYSSGGGKRRVKELVFQDIASIDVSINAAGTANERVLIRFDAETLNESYEGNYTANIASNRYTRTTANNTYLHTYDKSMSLTTVQISAERKAPSFFIYDNALIGKTVAQIKTALAGTIFYLGEGVEEDITAEENPGWQQYIYTDNYGTFEFTSEQTIQAPQAYFVRYTANLVDFLDSAYEVTGGSADNIALTSDLLPQKSSERSTQTMVLTGAEGENWSTSGSYSSVKRFNLSGKFNVYRDSSHGRGVGEATSEGLTINWIHNSTFSGITALSACFAGTGYTTDYASTTQFILLIPNSEGVSTVEQLRTWLTNHNITVTYEISKYVLEATIMNGEITYNWVIKE